MNQVGVNIYVWTTMQVVIKRNMHTKQKNVLHCLLLQRVQMNMYNIL